MSRGLWIVTGLILLISSLPAVAAQPDAGSILREHRESPPSVLPEKKPVVVTPTLPAGDKAGTKILVRGFFFEGLSQFPAEELFEALADLLGKELTMEQLEVAPQRIIAFYSKRGRIASAFLPQQEVKDGRILIKIIEGKLGTISIDPASRSRMSPDVAMAYLQRENKSNMLINMEDLERAVRLLKGLPGVSASTSLLPGKERGTSDLLLKLADLPLISGSVETDNQGSISSGEYRGAATLNLNNPFGYGDQVTLKGQSSLKNNYGRLAYAAPVGVAGSRLSFSSSYLHYDLGGELKSKGDAFTAGSSYSFPLLHRQSFNLSGQIGYEFRWLYNEVYGAAINNKRLHSGTIGLSADTNDQFLGGGFNSFSVGLGVGNVDLSAVSSDEAHDRSAANTSGLYEKLTFNVSRTQTIIQDRTTLSLSINGQYAFKNLDSSEQFGTGGFYAVRAYSSGEGSGDSGFVTTAELRHLINSTLQFALFYDVGWIRQHSDPWIGWNSASSIPNEFSLDGAGMGLTWTPFEWCMLKGIMAERVRDNRGANAQGKDSDGTKREPRFWFMASINF